MIYLIIIEFLILNNNVIYFFYKLYFLVFYKITNFSIFSVTININFKIIKKIKI